MVPMPDMRICSGWENSRGETISHSSKSSAAILKAADCTRSVDCISLSRLISSSITQLTCLKFSFIL